VAEATDSILPDQGCRIVEGQGHIDPLVMAIAEAPGEAEEDTGTPFIGPSGTLFRGELALSGIDPHAVYYTNAVKCRPYKNRTPTQAEIEAWAPDLVEEVYLRRPLHVILAGRIAERAWDLIRLEVEQIYDGLPTVHRIPHPSSIMRDRKKLPAWQAAMRRIGRAVNGEVEEAVVLRVPEPWEEGEPDYDAPWLSADTEFKLLNDGGSDEALVCVQVSDGVRSKLYRFDDIRRVRERLRGAHVYAHNISADARNMGIDLYDLESWDDTGLMAYVLRYPRVGLKVIGPELTGLEMRPISEILTGYTVTTKRVKLTKRGLPQESRNVHIVDNGDGTYTRQSYKQHKRDFEQALDEDYDQAKAYALLDPVVTARVAEELVPKLRAEPTLWRYYQDFEKPIVPIVEKMTRTGVQIDADALEPLRDTLDDAIAFHDNALREILGQNSDFNPRSAEKLARALIGFGLPLVDTTASGAVSVAEDRLLRAIEEVDLEKIDESTDDAKRLAVIHVLRSREYAKLRTTYVERLLGDRDAYGRIHASFNQMVADTNRFSSSGPNLQNIPARGNVGSAIRRAFIARPGYLLVKTDFSALEVRIFAHLTQDEAMIWAFQNGISPHDLNAQRFGVVRNRVKNWYFAVIYGAEPLKAALTAGVSIEDAWAMMRAVKEESPAILKWPVWIANELTDKGYVETIFGWRNYYPHFLSPIKSESSAAVREAANMPVQGSASGIVKRFMIEQDRVARRYDATIVLQVHDETVVEVPESAVTDFIQDTVDVVHGLGAMGVGFSVPLDVEVKVGHSWGEMATRYKEGKWVDEHKVYEELAA
jgi:uracil-DNA glycosylase family 4